MLIIINNQGHTIKNMGTNSIFQDGNIPNLSELPIDQKYVRLHDNSDMAKSIMEAHEYGLTLDDNDNVTAVNVIKTKKQWIAEQPPPPKTSKENAIDALKLIDLKSIDSADVLKRLEIIEGYLKITE